VTGIQTVAQIFVSHSDKDREALSLLASAFAQTRVKSVCADFETILRNPEVGPGVVEDVRRSNAVFLLLGKHAEAIKRTLSGEDWERGVLGTITPQTTKDVWVLETTTEVESLSVVVPRVRHYVRFDTRSREWQMYLTQVVESYDDSQFWKALSAGVVTGAAFGDALGPAAGAFFGISAGLLLAAVTSKLRPTGLPISCPQCSSLYSVHLAEPHMRCPVCNNHFILQPQDRR
jgi:hypothetical protein